MCGIAGAVGPQPQPLLVDRMLALLAHRGPDAAGQWADGGVVIGARRLAIVDVAGGHQPVATPDGSIVAVLNGEIYNHADLRAALRDRGHHLAGGSDTECLVHLYEEHGADLVDHLRGMFAFALWDRRRGRLLLARDRLGKKPLFWRRTSDGLQFASELKGFLADPQFPRDVDPLAVHRFLANAYVPGPGTIWRDVHRVPPATMLCWQDGRVSTRPYWEPPPGGPTPVGFDEAAEQLREHLLTATRLRLAGERRVGVLLSGGVDSSAVLAAAARQTAGPVRTFTVGFDDAAADERRYARAIAQRYGTDHHEWVLPPDVTPLLPDLTWHFDEPFADTSAVATLFAARMSRPHTTVLLNGDGGDECFGGYDRYPLMLAGGRLRLPGLLGAAAVRAGIWGSSRARGRRVRRAARVAELIGRAPVDRYAEMMSVFPVSSTRELYTEEFAAQTRGVDALGHIRKAWHESAAPSLLERMLDVDRRTYLAGDLLPKMDLATMAYGLEARSPLLDQELVSWSVGLPPRFKVQGRSTKRILKHAVRDWLPAELLDRPKTGFGLPIDDWLRGSLRELSRDLLTDATAERRGLLRPAGVRALLDAHEAGQRHGRRIWSLVQLELWFRRFADQPPAVSPAYADVAIGDGC